MLENVVHSVESLRFVKSQAAQHKAHTGIDLSYSQYTSLLLSSAQQHDKQLLLPSRSKYSNRKVYSHDVSTDSWQENGELEVNNTVFHDIDSSIQMLNIN